MEKEERGSKKRKRNVMSDNSFELLRLDLYSILI